MGLGSEIRDPEKTFSGSRGQKGTGSRIRNTGFFTNKHPISIIFRLLKRQQQDGLKIQYKADTGGQMSGQHTGWWKGISSLFSIFISVFLTFIFKLEHCQDQMRFLYRGPSFYTWILSWSPLRREEVFCSPDGFQPFSDRSTSGSYSLNHCWWSVTFWVDPDPLTNRSRCDFKDAKKYYFFAKILC